MASNIPIGTVIPFAGGLPAMVQAQGWMVCSGQTLETSQYRELFEAIGTANGGDGNNTFLLPNLQGLFIRGVDGGAGRDPNASTRGAPAKGAQTGDAVGSIQYYATKKPTKGFQAGVPHLPDEHTKGNYGSLLGDQYASWNSGSVDVTVTGGDSETRPVNAYVYFIIKYRHVAAYPGVPVGGIVPFAGDNVSALEGEYLLCDGRTLSSNDDRYAELYGTIGTSCGGDGLPDFNLPDYRGRFLRGVAGPSSLDPDKDARSAPAPGGNTGNNVGSVQGFATAKPSTAFTTSVPHLPKDHEKIDKIDDRNCSKWSDGSAVNLAGAGGDAETRPINVYVNWFIKVADAATAKG